MTVTGSKILLQKVDGDTFNLVGSPPTRMSVRQALCAMGCVPPAGAHRSVTVRSAGNGVEPCFLVRTRKRIRRSVGNTPPGGNGPMWGPGGRGGHGLGPGGVGRGLM
ncbi:hypothetical protein GCM10022226_29670 [Sphaerisporangium flaviroseum]|uniref:Ferrous iron transport protein A n=1 Tax=Sphaerisporangium flaviroseum TaxID=509199 RepID=A0ABP7I354_9ACTN